MNDLIKWLRGVLDDDEKTAKDATRGPWQAETHHHQRTGEIVSAEVHPVAEQEGNGDGGVSTPEDATHIARHDPTAVLADIEAKRAVLDYYEETRDTDPESLQPPRKDLHAASTLVGGMQDGLELAVRALARAYRHRPGWQDTWE